MNSAERGSHRNSVLGSGAVGDPVCTGSFMTSITLRRSHSVRSWVQRRKLRLEKVKSLVQSHGTKERRSWNPEPPKPMACTSVHTTSPLIAVRALCFFACPFPSCKHSSQYTATLVGLLLSSLAAPWPQLITQPFTDNMWGDIGERGSPTIPEAALTLTHPPQTEDCALHSWVGLILRIWQPWRL